MRPPSRSSVALLVLACLSAGCTSWCEARRLRARLVPFADAPALAKFDRLASAQRAELGRSAMAALERVRRNGWQPRLTDLETGAGGAPVGFVYQLQAGTTVLGGCRAIESGTSAAPCEGFRHARADGSGESLEQPAPVVVDLDAGEPRAASRGAVPLRLGAGAARAVGRVRVDAAGVHVSDGALRVPRPSDPAFDDLVPLDGDFSLSAGGRRELWSRAYSFEIAPELPAGLRAAFGASRYVILGVHAALRVDLHERTPVLRAHGELVLLNHTLVNAELEYWPGERLALQLHGVQVPTPLPGVQARLDGAFVEIDVRERSLRLAGQASAGWGVLVPVEDDAGWSAGLGHAVAERALAWGAGALGLPQNASAQGHLFLDWDDGRVCFDFGVQGTSLLHAAYLGDARLHVWAPVTYVGDLPDGPLESAGLLVGLAAAPWAPRMPVGLLRCYAEDPGSRSELRIRLLQAAGGD